MEEVRMLKKKKKKKQRKKFEHKTTSPVKQ